MGRRQPEKVAETHTCECGAVAVDKFGGRWVCRECLCPPTTPAERDAMLEAASVAAGTLAREMGGYEIRIGDVAVLKRSLNKAIERWSIAELQF
jgi:hypothetical protein